MPQISLSSWEQEMCLDKFPNVALSTTDPVGIQ